MKRLVIAVIALLAISSPAAAQRQSGPPQSNTGLFQGITLAPAQQKKVDSLWNANQPMRDKVRAQMESGQQPDSAQMATFRAMREKSIASYRAVLTPDQQKVFDKNIADMQSRMGSMGRHTKAVIAGSKAGYRSFALAAALVGWAAVALQSYITVNNSLSAGHGIGHGLVVFFGFFTVTTNSFMALVLTAHGLASSAPFWTLFRRPVVATSAAACMIVVGITYFFLLRRLWNPQGLQHVVDVALHYVMPILSAIFWWIAVPRGSVGWSRVGSMLVYPMVYLVYVFVRGPLVGSYPYYFIDVNALGLARSLLNAAALSAFFLLVLALMIFAKSLRDSRSDRTF